MVPSRPSAPPPVTGFALALAAVTAATLVVCWARDELPPSIRPRRALQSTLSSLPLAQDRVFGSPWRRIGLDDETPEFEPEAYARYYDDIATNNTDSRLGEHYLSIGRAANRVYQRLRVVLSYEPGAGLAGPMADKFGGLCNQIYSHVSILSVALYSGCEVVLPTATHRGGRQFQDDYDKNEIVALREPLSTLFDVDHLVKWADARDTVFHRDEPDLGEAVIAVEVKGPSICCGYPMERIVNTLFTTIKTAAEEYLRNNPGRPLPPVRLVLKPPMLLFALSTNATQDLIEDVSRNLRPAPHVQSLADAVVRRLTAAGPYNGVHLRMEEDAHMWDKFTSTEDFWGQYLEAMAAAGFDRSTPVYVASGLLSYMSVSDWNASIASRLLDGGVCSQVVHKESILGIGALEGLQSEALALVDLLVLVRARRFTGFGASTFSWVVEELRCLAGSPSSTTSYPKLSIDMLPDLWRDGKVLSNHQATCPDPAGAPRRGEAITA